MGSTPCTQVGIGRLSNLMTMTITSNKFELRIETTSIVGMNISQTQNICISFVQRRPNVFDDGPTLYKCYTNVSCLLNTPYIYTQPVTTPILLCNTNNGDHAFLESTVVCPDKTRSEYMKVISGLLWAYSKK